MMTDQEIANHLGITTRTLYNWRYELVRRPPYYTQAMTAVEMGLRAASEALTHAHWRELGVQKQHANYWRKAGQTPGPARMATAYIVNQRATTPSRGSS